MELKVKKLVPEAQIPTYGSAQAACFDIRALTPIDPVTFDRLGVVIEPGESFVFETGLAFDIPEGKVIKVYSRSGHGFKNGVTLVNGTGIIDADYTGELKIGLRNDGTEPFYVVSGDRLAQAMLEDVVQVRFLEVVELKVTDRGANGFGSTGVQ